MKLKTKIAIDQFIGLPIVYGLNALARILGFILRIDHSLEKPIKTIAVCKFIGLGSIIQATPLLQTLRKNYPEARIVFITNLSNKALLSNITEVDEVVTISDNGFGVLMKSTLSTLVKLWKNKPDIYIDLEIYSNYSSMVATLSLSKNRMGFYKNDKMYRKGMYTHMMFFNMKAPISQTYLQFARLLGCKNIITELAIRTDKNSSNTIKGINQKLNIVLQKYIVLNPNASDLRVERRWSSENFVALIEKINEEFPNYIIILIGAENEKKYVNGIISNLNIKKNVIDSSGKLNMQELIVLIANASLIITNDTGPMHIAFALKTKTLALFGPCTPQQYGGLENTISIYKNVYCSPCVHEFMKPPCNGDNQCMKKIKLQEVLDGVRVQLSSNLIFRDQQQVDIDYTGKNEPLGIIVR